MKDERRNYILVGLFVVAMGGALIVFRSAEIMGLSPPARVAVSLPENTSRPTPGP